ncbi:hypothetical protein GCM10020367_50120 [Streptomyces sannanensis]|uniref:Uncharacterized protein n=1 Tax=Streptomyces sannanensis TaxID=285536 RepID=A0ABP6SIL9_9ACTN
MNSESKPFVLIQELSEALAALGITLPSLGVDHASSAPLVELGRCNLDTARRLATVLREAMAR